MSKIVHFPCPTAERLIDPATGLSLDEIIASSRQRTMALAHAILKLYLQKPIPLPGKVFIAYGSQTLSTPNWHYLALDLSIAELQDMMRLVIRDLRGRPPQAG